MGAILSSLFGGSSTEVGPAGSSRVLTFHSSTSWELHFNACKQSPQLMVIDFSASWCGPCKFMEPAFINMADNFTDVVFVKIDVDELSDVAREFGIEGMPTFVLMKQGKEVDRLVGANKDKLLRKIKKHRPSQSAA